MGWTFTAELVWLVEDGQLRRTRISMPASTHRLIELAGPINLTIYSTANGLSAKSPYIHPKGPKN